MLEFGCNGRRITLYEGKVLDGWQMYRACFELCIDYQTINLPKEVDPEQFVETANEHRRHESQQVMERRAEKRRERVAARRKAGESIRTIAEAEGVSKTTVEDDLKEESNTAPGVHPRTGEPENGKVTGRDGKQYPASKPKIMCERCTRIGKEMPNCIMCKEARKGTGTPRAPRADTKPPLVDAFGVEVPGRCRDAYGDPWIQEAIDFLAVVSEKFRMERLSDGIDKRKKFYPFLNPKDFIDGCGFVIHYFDTLLDHLKANRPAGVCPSCGGEGCTDCKMCGMVPRELHATLTEKLT